MPETKTSDSADSEWTHPIPSDIVTDVAEEHEIDVKLLHRLLEEGSAVWDGQRQELKSVFDSLHFGQYYFRTRYTEGCMIVWGGHFLPKHLLRDVWLPDYTAEYLHNEVSFVRLIMAVRQAHRRYAKQLHNDPPLDWTPVVVRQPSDE